MAQDSASRHLDQFVVRLPEGMRDRIAELAKANNRSMNSEIVATLEGALLPGGAVRLRTLLEQVNSARGASRMTPSAVAEMIGESHPKAIAEAFSGKRVLSFAKVNAIANLWGVRPEWLKHGSGAAFSVRRETAVRADMSLRAEGSRPEKRYFLRSKCDSGELAVIVDHGDGHFETILIEAPLSSANSESIGSRKQALQDLENDAFGYTIETDVFNGLVRGDLYPGAVLSGIVAGSGTTTQN